MSRHVDGIVMAAFLALSASGCRAGAGISVGASSAASGAPAVARPLAAVAPDSGSAVPDRVGPDRVGPGSADPGPADPGPAGHAPVSSDPTDPAALFTARCGTCHHATTTRDKAPALTSLRRMPAERVFFAMSNGSMKAPASGLSMAQLFALVGYASAGSQADYQPAAAAMCSRRSIHFGGPAITRWGFDTRGSAALNAQHSAIHAGNVAGLTLKWAFGLPGATETRSQPVATSDTLFVAASSGHVFALDRSSGCIKWHRATPVRTALTLGALTAAASRPADRVVTAAAGSARHVLFFGDAQGHVTALDAADGTLVWREHVGLFPASMLTGAIVQHATTLYVPVSSIEVGLAADANYPCCRTHGGVRALAAASGEVLWTYATTADAQPTGTSSVGVPQWGPSGAPVWSAPVVDAKRGALYVGTGENYSSPPSERSDSIIALDLKTGVERWHFQARAGDAYNVACDAFPPGPNCPSENGPDFDFGAAVIISADRQGLLLAGQKSGDVWALDPDDGGRVVWQRRLGAGSKLGGVHWGMSVADGRLFVPIADPPLPVPGYAPQPGVYALRIDDGTLVWQHPIERGCATDIGAYFSRTQLYPECSFWFGPSNAPLALPGVLIVGALDGQLRAIATADGALLWRYQTARAFDTVNGVTAHGGAIDAGAAIALGNLLYVQSGYGQFGQLPGNVLLAFELPATPDGR